MGRSQTGPYFRTVVWGSFLFRVSVAHVILMGVHDMIRPRIEPVPLIVHASHRHKGTVFIPPSPVERMSNFGVRLRGRVINSLRKASLCMGTLTSTIKFGIADIGKSANVRAWEA